MITDKVELSRVGLGVCTLQQQADVLNNEIDELLIERQKLDRKISMKQTQRDACLATAHAFSSYQMKTYNFLRTA